MQTEMDTLSLPSFQACRSPTIGRKHSWWSIIRESNLNSASLHKFPSGAKFIMDSLCISYWFSQKKSVNSRDCNPMIIKIDKILLFSCRRSFHIPNPITIKVQEHQNLSFCIFGLEESRFIQRPGDTTIYLVSLSIPSGFAENLTLKAVFRGIERSDYARFTVLPARAAS